MHIGATFQEKNWVSYTMARRFRTKKGFPDDTLLEQEDPKNFKGHIRDCSLFPTITLEERFKTMALAFHLNKPIQYLLY